MFEEFAALSAGLLQAVLAWVCVVVEVCVYALLGYWTVLYFDLKVDWDKKSVSSKTGAIKFCCFIGQLVINTFSSKNVFLFCLKPSHIMSLITF